MIGKRSAVAAWILLAAALFLLETAGAQVPDVGQGRRIGDCWTDEDGVNHCGGNGAPDPKPDRPPRGDVSEADRIAANKKAAEKIADAAERLFYKNDYAGAEREFRRAVSLYAGDKDVWFTLGWAIHLQGRPEEALSAYKQAADLGHRKAKKRYDELLAELTAQRQARRQEEQRRWNQDQARERTYQEAVRLENQGQSNFAAAARLWRDYLRTYPNDVFASNSFGRLVYLAHLLDPNLPLDLIDEAVGAMQRAIRVEPGNAALHRRMMLLLARVGRADEAVIYAREAVDKESDSKVLLREFDDMLEWALARGNFDAAERMIEAAGRVLSPDWMKVRYSGVYAGKYNAAVKADDDKGAVAAARNLVRLYPERRDYRGLLGEALLRAGSVDEGKAEFAAGIRLAGNDEEKRALLGQFNSVLWRHTKDWDALLEGQRAYLRLVPPGDAGEAALMRALIANTLVRLQRREEARMELEKFFAHRSSDPETYEVVGNMLRASGENEGAARAYERALELKPGDPKLRGVLAEVRASAAREGLALRPLVPAVPSGPGGSGAVSPGAPPVDGNGFERSLATSGADLVRHARELRRLAGLPPREERVVVPVPFEVWEKKVREGKGLTPAELAAFSRNDWNYLGKLIAELHRDGETSGEALTGRELGRGASEAADRSGEWIARNRETVEAAADLLEYGSIAALPASLPVSVALGSAETSLTVLAKLLILKSEHPDKKDVPKALAWIVGPEAVKKIGGDKLKAVFIEAGIPGVKAEQLGFLTIKEAVEAVGDPAGR